MQLIDDSALNMCFQLLTLNTSISSDEEGEKDDADNITCEYTYYSYF